MKETLEKVLVDYKKNYVKILTNFYPANGKAGFLESNLTRNFVNSLINNLDDSEAIAWFNAAINIKEDVDAVVFSPSKKAVFFITANRFIKGRIKFQRESLNKSFQRAYIKENRNIIIDKWKDKNVFKNQYIICLSDVWLDSEDTIQVPHLWLSNQIIDGISKLKNEFKCISFETDTLIKENLKIYNLLVSMSKIE